MKVLTLYDGMKKNKTLLKGVYYDMGGANKFLPCILYLDSDDKYNYYILSYRLYKSWDTDKPKFPGNRSHPWYFPRWQHKSYDGTGFAYIKIKKSEPNVKILKDVITDKSSGYIDTRIYKTPQQKILATFNIFGKISPHFGNAYEKVNERCRYYTDTTGKILYKPSKKILVKEGLSDDLIKKYTHWGCAFMMTSNLNLGKSLIPKFTNKRIICSEHHGPIEKNHILVFKDNKMYVCYGITPLVFHTPLCDKLEPQNSTFFTRLVNFYDPSRSVFNKMLQLSPSTQFIEFNEKELICAGHFKLNMKEIKNSKSEPNGKPWIENVMKAYKKNKSHKYSKLAKFFKSAELKVKKYLNVLQNNLLKSKWNDWNSYTFKFDKLYEDFNKTRNYRPIPGFHYEFIYGFFLFTLHKDTLQLSRISDFYIIQNDEFNLMTYPSGLSHYGNMDKSKRNVVMSYHENDMMIKLAFMNYTECNRMLKYNEKSNVKDVDFKFLLVN